MIGIFAIKPKDIKMGDRLYTVHSIEIKSNGEKLADGVVWKNGYDYQTLSRKERIELIKVLECKK
jgi:hypothetical protein